MSSAFPSLKPAIPARQLLPWAFALGATCLLGASGYYCSASRPTLTLCSLGGAVTFACTAAAIAAPGFACRTASLPVASASLGLVAVWSGWMAFFVLVAVTHANNLWDECAFLLSGLALRGYPVPYAVHRPPVMGFVCALFAEVPQLISPVLLCGVLAWMTLWGIRRWGRVAAAAPLLMLLGQNAFLCSAQDALSELPGTLLLFGAFYLLSRGRFCAAGIAFALTALARWNLAVIPLALTIPMALQRGRKACCKYVAGGALVAAVFMIASLASFDRPFHDILHGNFEPAYAHAEAGETRPDFLVRATFYLSHFCFLTPLGLLAVISGVAIPVFRRSENIDDWCVRFAIPIGIATYCLAMFNIGGLYPRFMAPIIPLACMTLTDLTLLGAAWLRPTRQARTIAVLSVCSLTVAWGLWPASWLIALRWNVRQQPIFSQSLGAHIAATVPVAAVLQAPSLSRVSEENGYVAMLELRRELVFPTAQRTESGRILIEPDADDAIRRLTVAAPPGSFILVPSTTDVDLARFERVAGDGTWDVRRVPARRATRANPLPEASSH